MSSTTVKAPEGFRIVHVAWESSCVLENRWIENVFVIGMNKNDKKGLEWIGLPPNYELVHEIIAGSSGSVVTRFYALKK